ncbi:MAG: hypothetical protein MZV63_35115 [Marinilabiliales bacterium]|nr:hypothetical protein [Marinilabiliales bacterium]
MWVFCIWISIPRESKRQGAWCGAYRDHKVLDGKEITPVVTIVGNFTRRQEKHRRC